MDIATCTEDGHTYTAIEFSQLVVADLERKRRQLVCNACNNPAFFRKESRDGRGACFGARPHVEGCALSAEDTDVRLPGVADDQDELINLGDRIVVELAVGAPDASVHLDPMPRAPYRPRGGAHIGDGGPGHAVMHRRLSSLLRMLINAPNFRYSAQTIAVANQPELAARDFFVELGDVTRQHSGQFRGFWGQLTDAGEGSGGTLWLNSGGRGSMSFALPFDYRAAVMQRYHLANIEEFAGSDILVLGTLFVSQYGKMICAIDDPAMMTIRNGRAEN